VVVTWLGPVLVLATIATIVLRDVAWESAAKKTTRRSPRPAKGELSRLTWLVWAMIALSAAVCGMRVAEYLT
jgi:hypothetical protein